jgi:TPR repeat protein
MANREDLAIIRAARAGQAKAQLALGKRYLTGGGGLPQSLPTAMHWLERAARADQAEAWSLIGAHIPYELATQAVDVVSFSSWYERAFEQGMVEAGLVFAKLVLTQTPLQQIDGLHDKAIRMLETAARSGAAEAQWLLAQHDSNGPVAPALEVSELGAATQPQTQSHSHVQTNVQTNVQIHAPLSMQLTTQGWAERAADAGIAQAQYLLADAAWDNTDRVAYLRRALPLARALRAQYATQIAQLHVPSPALAQQLGSDKLRLLSRCCEALLQTVDYDPDELQQFWELAAYADDKEAQFALGLSFARMQADGSRSSIGNGSAHYKKAVRWLTLAGEGGLADAWYALSRIFLKPEFSQRSLADAQFHLERAAEMGHCTAQLECGIGAWRNRRDEVSNDVRAVYWLQKAAAQGNVEAIGLLAKITDAVEAPAWAVQARRQLTRAIINAHPFLAARVELAVLFGLSQAEALLIDINHADRGHCLVVDIRAQYARSKRRLISIGSEQRAALHRIGRLFEDVDCGVDGLEGNYRQRLYRLKTVLPQGVSDTDTEDEAVLEN